MKSSKSSKSLSIVTTLYKSQDYIVEFYKRCLKVSEEIFDDIEIIIVNDNSPDRSEELVNSLSLCDERIRIISLARNYGHHKAILTGLNYARGDYIWLIDSDLEEQPEWLIDFYSILIREKVDVVFGISNKRNKPLIENILAWLYYLLVNTFIPEKIYINSITARLMNRKYVTRLCSLNERDVPLIFLFSKAGLNQRPYIVEKKYKGKSSYTLLHKLRIVWKTLFLNDLIFKITFLLGILFIFISSLLFISFLLFPIYLGINPLIFYLFLSVFFCTGLIVVLMSLNLLFLTNIIESKSNPKKILIK